MPAGACPLRRSIFARAASSSDWPRATSSASAPAARTRAAAASVVTATVSRDRPAGSQAPPNRLPSSVRRRFSTAGAAASTRSRSAIWSSVSFRSRRIAASIPGVRSKAGVVAAGAGAGVSAAWPAWGKSATVVTATAATARAR
jgi:hypothetical protein